MTAACFLCNRTLVSAFVTDAQTVQLGMRMVNAIILSGPVLGLYFLTTNILQAAGKSLWPTLISLSRQGLVYISCLILLNAAFGLGGLLYTQAVADLAATVLSIVVCVVLLRKSLLPNDAVLP